ncbi:MAG: DNA repair protein RecN [Oscillospiraceae bacterium]|jgi:DNA repair protein RecN (Recombination protein N)|nr:DNA repair protein RecN [Oscillospiraceae bacterium]
MLQSLTIENIAVIKQAKLEFSSGFVAMTGETGAGKSIVIDSIQAVLGERASRELVRTGADSARVSALFQDISSGVRQLLEQMDLPCEEDGSLLLSRSISAGGKNSCRVNGQLATVSALKAIGGELITIHGQHDSQALLDPERHLRFLDVMAENDALRTEYRESYAALRRLQREQDALQMDENEKARRLDMLRHQITELEAAALQPGEREQLLERRELFLHAEKVLEALHVSADALSGAGDEGGAVSLAHASAIALERAGEFYPAALSLCERVRTSAYELEEASAELRELFSGVQFDPAEAEETERRLDIYYRLSQKYGQTEEEMLSFLENACREEASITQSEARILALEQEIEARKAQTILLAKQLSKERRRTAAEFAARVREELADLDMPRVRFEVTHEKIPLTPEGGDRMQFLISANAGEEPRPLAKIASGGELSRIMLAIKNVLAEKDEVATLIFDEIDAGVSGRAAQKIARKLVSVASGRQVICVTHLAQIAALAAQHLFISKSVSGEETLTQVDALDREGRKRELARIIGGETVTPAQLLAAAEMLDAG